MSTATNIEMQVNAKALVSNMRLAFTRKTQYLAELMQNARRAGASYVAFEYNSDEQSLTIRDDGRGIDNMQDLLNVAFSGWDEHTKEDETPYGIGFLSALFTAERVVVESQGRKVDFTTQSALDFEQIQVERGSVIGGTEISLFGGIENPVDALNAFARGFSIQVNSIVSTQKTSLMVEKPTLAGFIFTGLMIVKRRR